jgi:hypothetical protein
MLLLSLETLGDLLYAETEESIYEQIALEIDEETNDVKMTLLFLQSNNLAEINETSDISFTEAKELIHSESDSTQRVRKHREKKSLEVVEVKQISQVTKIDIDIDVIVEEFKAIIKKYYKNVSTRFGTKTAKDKIKVAIKKNHNIEEIKKGYENYLIAHKHKEIDYIQKFETFMNQESWRDYQERIENNQVQKTNGKRTEIVPVFDDRTDVDEELQRQYEEVLKEMKEK